MWWSQYVYFQICFVYHRDDYVCRMTTIRSNTSTLMNQVIIFNFINKCCSHSTHKIKFFHNFKRKHIVSHHKMKVSTKLHEQNYYHVHFQKLLLGFFCFENAYIKLMTLCKRFNHTNTFLNFMSTILLHECFIEQACKSHLIVGLKNMWTPSYRHNKGYCGQWPRMLEYS